MNLIKLSFGIVASCIGIWSFIPYIKDIFLLKTKPHTFTWLIWTILQGTGVVGMYNNGAGIGALSLAIGVFFCGFVWILSLRYGSKNITLFDKVCLTGALAAIAVYLFLHSPLLSVILVSVIDLTGFLPTYRKVYHEPNTETLSMYVLFIISGILSVLAISSYSFITLVYPLCLINANTLCAGLIVWRRKTASPNP